MSSSEQEARGDIDQVPISIQENNLERPSRRRQTWPLPQMFLSIRMESAKRKRWQVRSLLHKRRPPLALLPCSPVDRQHCHKWKMGRQELMHGLTRLKP